MDEPGFKERLDKKRRALLLEELNAAMMQNDRPAARKLAKEAGIPFSNHASGLSTTL